MDKNEITGIFNHLCAMLSPMRDHRDKLLRRYPNAPEEIKAELNGSIQRLQELANKLLEQINA
jgi:hypothetical protein